MCWILFSPIINSWWGLPLSVDNTNLKKLSTYKHRENKSHNFILKWLLKYTELLQCNGEGELRKFSREGRLAICQVCVFK